MRLTKKKALGISIELWEWLAETGASSKSKWDGWAKYGFMLFDCPLCEYYRKRVENSCDKCSFYLKFGRCTNIILESSKARLPFEKWNAAKTERTKKKYAKLFLEQLYQLRGIK